MDMDTATDKMKLDMVKKYFKVGWFFLPLLWAVNAMWFYEDAFVRPPFKEQKEIKRYVILSAIGAIVWGIILTIWMTLYHLYRLVCGAGGDSLTYIVPLGKP